MTRATLLSTSVGALLAILLTSLATAHDPNPSQRTMLPALEISTESSGSATISMDVPLGTGQSRSVKASLFLRLQSGEVRVEFIDPETKSTFSSGLFSSPAIEIGEEYEIGGEGTLDPGSRKVLVRVTVMAGSVLITSAQAQRIESNIEEEDFGDRAALRAAVEALEGELSDLPTVSREDHSSTCSDPTHNHGAHGHSHDHSHDHGEDHSHGHSHDGAVHPLDLPATQPLDISERAELKSLRLEVKRLRGELDALKAGGEKASPKRERGRERLQLTFERPAQYVGELGPMLFSVCTTPLLDRDDPAPPETTPFKVVATLPILASIAKRIGGDAVTTVSLSPPGVDPHDVRMTPALTTTLQNASLFIESGMGLEGWTSRAVTASGNSTIVPGEPGHLFASTGVTPVEIPTAEEIAAGGHVHAAGNPHVWLSPLNVKVIASNIEAKLSQLSPNNASDFGRRSKAFRDEIDQRLFGSELVEIIGSRSLDRLHRAGKLIPFLEAKKLQGKALIESLGGWLARTRSLEQNKLITYHSTWSYFANCFGLEVVATIEEKPGIPPSPAHLVKLMELAKSKGISIVASPPYYPRNRIDSLAQRIGGRSVVLPTQPGEADEAIDTLTLFETLVKRIESAQ